MTFFLFEKILTRIAFGVLDEMLLAGIGAEVVSFSFALNRAFNFSRIELHTANYINNFNIFSWLIIIVHFFVYFRSHLNSLSGTPPTSRILRITDDRDLVGATKVRVPPR